MWASGTADGTIFAVETRFPTPGTCHIDSSAKDLNLASRSPIYRDSLIVGRQGQILPCYPSARFSAGRLARRVARPGVRVSTSRAIHRRQKSRKKLSANNRAFLKFEPRSSSPPTWTAKSDKGSDFSTWE